MLFDKNQSVFPSDFHREVWWWAVGIVPPEVSLTSEVRAMCSPEILEGCLQWHAYFCTLCEDMYNNAEAYIPASARQYRDILEKIAATGIIGIGADKNRDGDWRGEGHGGGEGHGHGSGNGFVVGDRGGDAVGGGNGVVVGDKSRNDDVVVWDAAEWKAYCEKMNKSKQYAERGATLEDCLDVLARTGLEYERNVSVVTFRHSVYPKIFHAMQAFERSPRVRETPARHHFAHCEFRQLFKSYNANYDELMRRASDENLYIAKTIHEYCISQKMQRHIHFGIIKYKYKNVRVLDYNLYGDEYPTLRVNIGPHRLNPRKEDLNAIINFIAERKDSIDSDIM